MTAEELRAALARFGFTQEGLAVALGYSARQGQRWASNDAGVPGAVAVIMRLLMARPELLSVLAEIAPMPAAERKSKRGRKPAAKPGKAPSSKG